MRRALLVVSLLLILLGLAIPVALTAHIIAKGWRPWEKRLDTTAVLEFGPDAFERYRLFAVYGDFVQPHGWLDRGHYWVMPLRDEPVRVAAVPSGGQTQWPDWPKRAWLDGQPGVRWSAEVPVRCGSTPITDPRQEVQLLYRAEVTDRDIRLTPAGEKVVSDARGIQKVALIGTLVAAFVLFVVVYTISRIRRRKKSDQE